MGYFSNLDIQNKEEQGREESGYYGPTVQREARYRSYNREPERPYKVWMPGIPWPNCYETLEGARRCKEAHPGARISYRGKTVN